MDGPRQRILEATYACVARWGLSKTTAEDAAEYMLAGATAVQVGTATFLNPTAMIDVIDGLAAFCAARSIPCVAALTGALCREEADEAELDWLEPAR